MNRSDFLKALAALPFVGRLVPPVEAAEAPEIEVEVIDARGEDGPLSPFIHIYVDPMDPDQQAAFLGAVRSLRLWR